MKIGPTGFNDEKTVVIHRLNTAEKITQPPPTARLPNVTNNIFYVQVLFSVRKQYRLPC